MLPLNSNVGIAFLSTALIWLKVFLTAVKQGQARRAANKCLPEDGQHKKFDGPSRTMPRFTTKSSNLFDRYKRTV